MRNISRFHTSCAAPLLSVVIAVQTFQLSRTFGHFGFVQTPKYICVLKRGMPGGFFIVNFISVKSVFSGLR